MGGLISGLADKASSLLGGSPAPAPAPSMQKVHARFVKAGAIDDPSENTPGATALEHPNIFDPKMPIEFIHFGRVHTDVHDRFVHDKIDDTIAKGALKTEFGSRAIMFRAALEREAILADGFIASAKSVVQEMKDSQGPLDSVVGALGSLVGGSTAAAGPDPAQLDPYQSGVGAAGGKVNVAAIQYKDVHQSGIDLNQAWYNFDGFAPGMAAGSKEAGGGLLGNLPSALPLPALPGVGDALSTVTGILFKMFEIYEATYLKLRAKYEPVIRDNCYSRSMQAIRGRYEPLFDVWSVPAEANEDPASPAKILHMDKTGLDAVDNTVRDVNKLADDVSQKKKEIEDKWKNFWASAPIEGPGQAELSAILAACAHPDNEILDGFRTALKIGDLPGFVKTAVGKITGATTGMLAAVYLQLQNPAVARQMDEHAFLAAGRKYFEGVLAGLANDILPAMQTDIPMLGKLSSKMLAQKGASYLDDAIGKEIDPILEFAMGSLNGRLQAARRAAESGNSMTMEVYLAQLPLLIALMTRNTFFPVWQLIVGKLFGALGGVSNMLTSPVTKLMQTGRDTAGAVKRKAQDLDSSIKDTAKDLSSTVDDKEKEIKAAAASANVNLEGDPLGGAPDSLAKTAGDEADSILGAATGSPSAPPGPPPSFPGSARLKSGSGIEIKKGEWDDVDANQKVQAD